ARPRSARSHAPARARQQGVHVARGRRAAAAGPADRRRAARPRRGRRADGPDRGLRLPPAGHRHLRDARRPSRRPRALQELGARHRARPGRPLDAAGLGRAPAGHGGPPGPPGLLPDAPRGARRADLLSSLIATEEAGDRLSEDELLATCILLLIAGHETTANLIGNGVLALLRHPDELRRLRQDPGLIQSAVEELLRYDGPVQRTARVAGDDVTIGGRTIRKGDMVMPFIGAADRDPAQFPDPDRLDLSRADNRHLALGWGIHFCLGAPLARVEGQIAIDALVRRLPRLALVGDTPEYRQSLTLRGLKTLPVKF